MLGKRVFGLLLVLLFAVASLVNANEYTSWPREMRVTSGRVTIYQPQIESLEGNVLKGRAAIAYYSSQDAVPIFGVAWFTSRVDIDRGENTVFFETLTVTRTRLPDGKKNIEQEFKQAVDASMQGANLTMSLDALTTALAAVGEEKKQAAELKNAPPQIIYLEEPALLVTIDGQPNLQKVEKSKYQLVINTPYPLFTDGKEWYLNVADKVWYRAVNVDALWTFDQSPPAELVQLVAGKAKQYKQEPIPEEQETITSSNAPKIVVSHHPAELIVSVGKASFVPLTESLLAMNNTESNVFMDVKSQQYFLVISGRWYRADSMKGDWQYVASDKLPAGFQDLPTDSRYEDIRAFVAGTDEAKEAIMDAQIPQTAAVKRGTVDIEVVYDGPPQFEKIDGTTLLFAVNCSETVIKAGQDYYLVKDAVWYSAGGPTGPWAVSDKAPPGIEGVPPSSPVYNTKYVYVYDTTPDVVYVGYTPGYVGSYVYGPTIVYGTGWYYRPWITPYYYYPRPVTWGFSVSYNPWVGWGFGMSWSRGPFSYGFYSGGGYHGARWGHGWYGPRGYRTSFNTFHIDTVNINRNTYNRINNRNNLYRSPEQRAHIHNTINSRPLSGSDRQAIQNRIEGGGHGAAATLAASGAAGGAAAAINRQNLKNDVIADRDGNVLRNKNGQWQQRSGGQWQNRAPVKREPVKRDYQRSGYDRPSSIDRQQHSRQRATMRSSRPRMGGGMHRGGGRRR